MKKLYVIDLDKEGISLNDFETFSKVLNWDDIKLYTSIVWESEDEPIDGKINMRDYSGSVTLKDFPVGCLYDITDYKKNSSFDLVKDTKFSINDYNKFKQIEPNFDILKNADLKVYVVGPVSNAHHDGYMKAIVEFQNFFHVELKYIKIPHIFF